MVVVGRISILVERCGVVRFLVVVAECVGQKIKLASREDHNAVYRDHCMHLVKVKRGVRGYSRCRRCFDGNITDCHPR